MRITIVDLSRRVDALERDASTRAKLGRPRREPEITRADLVRWINEEGRNPAWLARRIGVTRQQVSTWTTGLAPVPSRYVDAIRRALCRDDFPHELKR